MKKQPHIFISYARKDRARVAVLAQLFEAEGWAVWWDRDNIPAGQQFDQIIDQAIEEAACVLVCWSEASVASGWVIAEAAEGLAQKKLLPVLLEAVRQPLRFRSYHAIDLSDWDERNSHDDYRRLKAELQRWQLPLDGQSDDEKTVASDAPKAVSSAEEIPLPQDHKAKDQWSPEVRKLLDELDNPDTNPERRLEIGDKLNEMPGGDPRFGVGLNADGWPEIDWVNIPAGEFIYGEGSDEGKRYLDAFEIARYPVTNAQYQAFVDDKGYEDERWWQGLRKPQLESSRWPQGNRPRTNVDWYEATAFARWLSYRLGYTITLPHETQWERAARGQEGRTYPWGVEYLSGYANMNEKFHNDGPHYLAQTTAAGVYRHAPTPEGILDLCGNAWEWCLNDYHKPDEEVEVPGTPVLRGGSWSSYPESARAASRDLRYDPAYRGSPFGFRLLRSPPS